MNKTKVKSLIKGILLFSFLSMSACTGLQTSANESEQPNILLLLADDLGYGDIGCYGGEAHTPNLDTLALGGIKFTNFYAAAPNCSPSRVGLMTGKSPTMLGMYSYRPPNHPLHLLDQQITIAEVLRSKGYSTAHIGKWHLGCLPQDPTLNHPQPHDHGFDYSLGTANNAQPSHLNPHNFVRNGVELDTLQGYACQLLADEAINWLDQERDKDVPFFAYLAFHEPHAKIASPPELTAKYSDYSERDAEYFANIENLDSAIGRVIGHLAEQNILDNTMIIFGSDNGSYRKGSNGDLRALKSFVYEGGIRVPGIINWPALNQRNVVIDEPVGFIDMMPTLCDVLDIKPSNESKLDGTSILDLIKGGAIEREKPLYWHFYRTSPEMSMRIGDMLITGKDADTIPRTHRFGQEDMEYIRKMQFVEYELYDLSTDISQVHNLIETCPKTEEYKELLNKHLEDLKQNGHYWDNLPDINGGRKLKKDWVKY